ncbi:MAG TPA: HD domain-containing phosphohydrolase [Solirubrobacteraceae bacterium]|jgi:putative two-component system response regulator|nr:HD domain-containing phosphohydrolase [Solirubrobacteraceae bacterium]
MAALRLPRRNTAEDTSLWLDPERDMLWAVDLDGNFLHLSRAWERELGQPIEALRGNPLSSIVHPHDREVAEGELRRLLTGAGEQAVDRVRFRNRVLDGAGDWHWLDWSARLAQESGSIHGVARDVTSQRREEQRVSNDARRLEERVADRTLELREARAETLQLLAVAGEYRDDETFEHTERVGALAGQIAVCLGLSGESIGLLREAAPLHDIGKLAIPDAILLKPGRLTPQERAVMEAHTTLGARLLFGSHSPVLQLAGTIAGSHHERWDGGGYPDGLEREEIPLVGRIVAVADVFDALTHERPYKEAWPVGRATTLIERGAGSQFDERCVTAFLATYQAPSAGTADGGQERPPIFEVERAHELGANVASIG